MVAALATLAILVFKVVCAAGAAFAVYTVVKFLGDEQKRTRDQWDAAGRSLGLTRPTSSPFAASTLEGVVDGLHVQVRGFGGKGARTIYHVDVPFSSLRLKREGLTSALGRLVNGDDVHLGDAAFDDRALVRGDEAELRALFDAETRAAALAVFSFGGWVEDGKVRIEHGGYATEGAKIEERTRAALALGQRLAAAERTPVWQRLAGIAAQDPLPRVRQNALASLVDLAKRGRAPQGEGRDAVLRALEDPDAGNRLFAATRDGVDRARGRPVIAAVAWDPTSADDVRAKAVTTLGAEIDDLDGVEERLDALLLDGGDATRIAAIGTLARRKCEPSRVIRFATHADGPTRIAVANGLRIIGNPSAQSVLVSMLEDPAEPVRLAAVRALGAVADVSAVEKLLPLMPGFFGGDLKAAAEDAVARIQSRASGAGAGQLSLSEAPDVAGALSAVAVEEGALSLPETARPRPRKTTA